MFKNPGPPGPFTAGRMRLASRRGRGPLSELRIDAPPHPLSIRQAGRPPRGGYAGFAVASGRSRELPGRGSPRLQDVGVTAQTKVIDGDAAEQILAFAHENQIGLAILSSHGQSGLSGWNVSSVVQKVIMRAPISLMIVRAYQPAQSDLAGLRYRRLMVPLDGSPRAESVLPLAATLARASEAQVLLAHVVQRPQMPRRTPPSQEDSDLADRIVERNRTEAEQYLEVVRSQLPPAAVETRLLISNHAAVALHELADQENADLVLICAHGYSGELRWPYGGLAAGFVAYGSSPLLIFQDAPAKEIAPTPAEVAAQKNGRR